MATNTKPTLEAIVTRYRREAARDDESKPELEVRLQDVDYANFATIYEALRAGTGPGPKDGPKDGPKKPALNVGPGRLTQMVGVIMDVRQTRGEGPQRHLRPSRIREIYFAGGKKSHEKFVRKEPLVLPVRVPSTVGLAYLVALSAERPDDQGFSSDEGALIRVKARVSFPLTLVGAGELRPELHWRIDMTVTRQIMGSDAATALPMIINQMFRTTPAMTLETFLPALQLDNDALPAPRQLFSYEVEAEFAGPEESRDALRPADVTAVAETVLRLANPEYIREAALQAEVYRIAQYVVKAPGYLRRFQHELGLKRLLPQALAITRADYRAIYPPKGFYLTVKIDGTRAVATVHDGKGAIAADTLREFSPSPAKGSADPLLIPDTIVDGEVYVEDDGEVTFFPFDVVAVGGEDVTGVGFEKRYERFDAAIAILKAAGVPAAKKDFVHLASDDPADIERAVRAVLASAGGRRTDGVVMVEPGKPYSGTRNFKWKSAEDNTIDFLARRAPASVLGKAPFVDRPGHKVYFLFVGITPELYGALGLRWCPGYADLFGETGPVARGGGRGRGRGDRGDRGDRMDANTGSYFPIQFSPSDVPLAYVYQHPDDSLLGEVDGKVIEGRCTGGCAAAGGGAALVGWEMVRVREDRRRELLAKQYYGNDYYTAELIWLNYVDPFPVEQLWEGPSLDYFMRPKPGIYRAQTAVISYVKTQRILSLKHAVWVVDFAAGKGQDLGRYLDAEVQHLVAVDQDRAALSELVRKKYSLAEQRAVRKRASEGDDAAEYARRGREARAQTATTVHILYADVSAPHMETIRKLEILGLPRATADAVVCNLAVHYFLGSLDGMRNFVALARATVKVGGQVILTVLLGEAVHALFKEARVPEGGSWDLRENEALKYSLRRLYASETLEAVGQLIGVIHPFSAGRYYEEFLVNTKVLTAEFVNRGFSVAARTNAAKAIPDFEVRNRSLAAELTAGDRQYLGLYGELVYQRDK